jgi:hypothetical protein
MRFSRANIILGSGLLLAGSVVAFNLDGGRWNGGSMVFHTGIPGISPSGTSWSQALSDALDEWTDETDFNFVKSSSYSNPCSGYSRNIQDPDGFPAGGGNQVNGADFRPDVCGNEFGTGVLAITLTLSTSGKLGFANYTDADIVFNSAFPWDIYAGARRNDVIDFRRVALHELGHAIGLDHESNKLSIMAPRITDLDSLAADDINGINSVYGSPDASCLITDLASQSVTRNTLADGDCRIQDFFNGGSDSSFVDAYRLTLDKTSTLNLTMESEALDSVIIIANPQLGIETVFDDGKVDCNVGGTVTLNAGTWLLLANTFDEPQVCPGTTGTYTLSITDSNKPGMGSTRSTDGSETALSLFVGGASTDGGLTYRTSFAANENIDVQAEILIDPAQAGQTANFYILVTLGDGRQFMKNSAGKFEPFSGNLATLVPASTGVLGATAQLDIIRGLKGSTSGLAGQTIVVHVGYALADSPARIQYGSQPIRFSIAK